MDVDNAPTEIQLEFIKMQTRTDLKAKYIEMSLGEFFQKHLDQDKFPQLKKSVPSKMALFGSTYVCEQFFPKLGFIKFLHQSVLTNEPLENRLRVASTSIKANLNRLVEKANQLQISH